MANEPESGNVVPGLSSLEQVNGLICKTARRPTLTAINHDAQKAIFFRPRCKLWSCPACAEINKRLWSIRTFYAIEKLSEQKHALDFLTITSHEKLQAKASLFIWPKAWSKLSQRARRQAATFQYLLVPEQHQDGRLHVHAIETSGLGKRWWKDNARQCGLGYMVDESEVRSPVGAAVYVSKYLTKSLEADIWPKGFRRVRVSQKWPKLVQENNAEGWTFEVVPVHQAVSQAVSHLEKQGYDVLLLDHIEAWEVIQEFDGTY